jgi:hypothetical protein
MTFPKSRLTQILRSLTLAVCLVAAGVSHSQVSPNTYSKLEALQASPDTAGTLVYRGATFTQRDSTSVPLYRYERRVVAAPTGLNVSHITSDPAGRVIIVESASLSNQYEIRRFDTTNQQAGFTGSVQVSNDGRHLTYELNDNGRITKASEDVSDPVVSGPSMFGFILKNWEPLKAGTSLPVRMLVLKEKTTYGFDIKFEKQVSGQASFTITPSNFLIRMAIAPLRVVFDANTKTPLRYEGRVPPLENVAGKLKDLDARVEYSAAAPAYR